MANNTNLISKVVKGVYFDSIILMQVNEKLHQQENIIEAFVGMGTNSNKSILAELKLTNDELENAGSDDLIISVRPNEKMDRAEILAIVDRALAAEVSSDMGLEKKRYSTVAQAIKGEPTANLVFISVPGQHAAIPAREAIERNLPVLIFSDHVSINDEIKLKQLGQKNQVLVMGPDCGACNINQKALALSSILKQGHIGIVGASGSGLQEVGVLLTKLGLGVSQAIGTGGRDLADEISASTMIHGIRILNNDPDTDVIVLVGKKPSSSAEIKLKEIILACSKPIICCFLDSSPEVWNEVGAWYAPTLLSAATAALMVLEKKEGSSPIPEQWEELFVEAIAKIRKKNIANNHYIRGVFGAGTFAAQAQILLRNFISPIYSNNPISSNNELTDPLVGKGHSIIDIGDEAFTSGRPHPVVDPLPYRIKISKDAADNNVSIILFDEILGPACYSNPSSYILNVVNEARKKSDALFVASICGTDYDPQNYSAQEDILRKNDVIVLPSSTLAALAVGLAVSNIENSDILSTARELLKVSKPKVAVKKKNIDQEKKFSFEKTIHIINVGPEFFTQSLKDQGIQITQVDWRPPAGGDSISISLLNQYNRAPNLSEKVEKANQTAFENLVQGFPVWTDVKQAGEIVEGFERNLILHSGPPIDWDEMVPAQKGGILGGIFFEGLAQNEDDAIAKIRKGEIKIASGLDYSVPCGAMASTSWSMPLVVIEDQQNNTFGFTALQEGPFSESLRWGVYSPAVLDRWKWLRDQLGPALSRALKSLGGLPLRPIISRSLQMGDENHSRELGTNLMVALELSSAIFKTAESISAAENVFTFIRTSERFVLHVIMASATAVLRSINNIKYSSLVIAMGGNGVQIGIKVSGLGNEWFTAPAPIAKGKYLNPEWTPQDTIPFAGDSCVIELYGLGGFAAAASPSVALLTGGAFQDSIHRSQRMGLITHGKNIAYQLPYLEFMGVPTGLDIVKVIESGIEPESHAGIALKQGGQAGAGVANIPMDCFRKAFASYYKKYGGEV